MDERRLKNIIQNMEKKLDKLTEILEDHEQRSEGNPNVTFDPSLCLSIVDQLRDDLHQDAGTQAANATGMIHHICDRVIRNTVDRLAHTMRSNSPESQFASNLIDLFFKGTEGDQRRKDIERRLRQKFGWDKLGSLTYESMFGDAITDYEYDVEEAALKYAFDDIADMVAAMTPA